MKLIQHQKRTAKCPYGEKELANQRLRVLSNFRAYSSGQVVIYMDAVYALHLSKDEALRLAAQLIESANQHSNSKAI